MTTPTPRTADDAGMTLVELLVVFVVIAILSAIAVPVFVGQRERAVNTTTTNDLASAKLSLLAYSMDNDGDYTTDTSALRKYGFKTSTGVEFSDIVIILGGEDFCIEAAAQTGTWFSVTSTSSVHQSPCA